MVTVNSLSFSCAHFWVNVSWPLSASFLFLGASPVCVLQAFKSPAKGQSLSPGSSYRILVVEYHSGLGMSIHQPITVARREAHTDWSELVYGSTLRSWEISINLLAPRRLRVGSGHFPKEKSGCCYQRKRGEDNRQAQAWISTPLHPLDFNCALPRLGKPPAWWCLRFASRAARSPRPDFTYSVSTPLSPSLQSWYCSLSPRGWSKWPSPCHNQWHSVRCDRRGHLALVPLPFVPVQRRGAFEAEAVRSLPPQTWVCGTETPQESNTWHSSPFPFVKFPISIGLGNNNQHENDFWIKL